MAARTRPADLWRRAIAGALAVSGVGLAAWVSDRHISANNATLAMSLTPVVIAIVVSARGEREGDDDLTARLWPGLMGLAGLLLLLPQPSLGGWRFVLALCLIPALTGIAAAFTAPGPARVRGASDGGLAGRSDWETMALLLGGLFFLALSLAHRRPDWQSSLTWSAAALDGLASLLSLLVLSRLGPTRWAAQFLVVPLLTMLEGVAVLRPVLDARSWVAFGLLAISGAYLFRVGRVTDASQNASTLV